MGLQPAHFRHVRGGAQTGATISRTSSRAGDEGKPLYFVFRLWNDYEIEPTWGRFGAFENWKLSRGRDGAELYMMATNPTVPQRAVSLTIKPFTQMRRQRLAQATGGVLEYTPGMSNGSKPLGTLVLPDSYNDFTNPFSGTPPGTTGGRSPAAMRMKTPIRRLCCSAKRSAPHQR